MADKSFGVKQVNLINASGTPRIESPNNLNINAVNVAISTDISVGGQLSLGTGTSISSPATNILTLGTNSVERVRINSTGNVGIGTDNPSYLLDVKTTDDTTYTAGNFVNNPVARLHNQSFTTDSFASLVFRTGSGDNAIGFVYPGTVNQADFVICNDGGSNGVERFRITSSGVVGIGTDNPESGSKLTVNGGIFVKSFLNSATIHGGGLDYVNDGRGTRITSFGASGAKTAISFAQGNGGSGASEIARFDTNGNLVFASSGQGINFSATADSGSSGITNVSEVLDDYEEGDWIPTMFGGTTAGTTTYTHQTGNYTKIGNRVIVSGTVAATTSGASGSLRIGNFPFVAGDESVGTFQANEISAWGSGVEQYSLIIQSGNSYCEFRGTKQSGQFAVLTIQNVTYLRFNVSYTV